MLRGINDSLELIQRTRGGGWPIEPVTEEVDYVDLVWHELEFREGYSFSYAVYDTSGGYVGCSYFNPVGRRTPLTEQMLAHDVDVSWWVTPAAYDRGHYVTLYRALRRWVVESFPFGARWAPSRKMVLDRRTERSAASSGNKSRLPGVAQCRSFSFGVRSCTPAGTR